MKLFPGRSKQVIAAKWYYLDKSRRARRYRGSEDSSVLDESRSTDSRSPKADIDEETDCDVGDISPKGEVWPVSVWFR